MEVEGCRIQGLGFSAWGSTMKPKEVQEMAAEKIKHASKKGVYRLRCGAAGVEISLTYMTLLDGRLQQVPSFAAPPCKLRSS